MGEERQLHSCWKSKPEGYYTEVRDYLYFKQCTFLLVDKFNWPNLSGIINQELRESLHVDINDLYAYMTLIQKPSMIRKKKCKGFI